MTEGASHHIFWGCVVGIKLLVLCKKYCLEACISCSNWKKVSFSFSFPEFAQFLPLLYPRMAIPKKYTVLPHFAIKKSRVLLCRRIKSRRRQIQTFDENNNWSTTLLTSTIWKCNFAKNRTVYELSAIQKRWLGSQKVCFWKKVCKKKLNKEIKNGFFSKNAFFESLITEKQFIFEHGYVSYDKRQKSCTFIVILIILSYLTSPIFNSSSKSTGFFLQTRKYYII